MGKGGGNSVVPTYAGMKYDIEMLLSTFKDNGNPRFTVFRQLFQQQQFGSIFAGRLAPAELVEFSERLLQMAAEYMHPNKVPAQPVYLHGAIPMENVDESSRSLLERLFGVYLTYSLFFLQPSNYVSQVRVTPVQMNECRGLLDKLIEDNHLDAVACIMKLIAYRAFHVVAFSGSFDPTSHRRYELAQEDDDNIADCVEPFSDLKAFISDPLVKQLELLSQTTPKCSYEKQILKIREIADNAHCSVAAGGAIDSGPSTSGSGSDRKGIKDRHYTGSIVHNRNRRYADPNLVVGSSLSDTDELSTDPISSKTPSAVKEKKRCGRPKVSRNSETIESENFNGEPKNKRGRRVSTGNRNGSPELTSTVDIFASLDDESNKNKNIVRMTPKRPVVNDAKFYAKIKSVSARSKKQKENDLLLEDLMKDS